MSLGNYTLKRILLAVPVLLGMSVIVFLLMKLTPGDTVSALLPPASQSPSKVAQVEEKYGLNQPLAVQYGKWLFHALQGDLGRSYASRQQVSTMVLRATWPTLQLGLVAYVFTLLLAFPIGILSAVYKDSWIDDVGRTVAFGGISIPSFWLGIMIIFVFSLIWDQTFGYTLIPSGGYVPFSEGFVPWFRHILGPAITIGVGMTAILTRQIRSAMVEVLNEEYIHTARSKGVKESIIVLVHGMRNALIPVVTIIGFQIGFLFNGAVVTEQIFQWPGIGQLLYDAVISKDMPVIQGTILLIATIFVIANLVVDLTYAYLDPRIEY